MQGSVSYALNKNALYKSKIFPSSDIFQKILFWLLWSFSFFLFLSLKISFILCYFPFFFSNIFSCLPYVLFSTLIIVFAFFSWKLPSFDFNNANAHSKDTLSVSFFFFFLQKLCSQAQIAPKIISNLNARVDFEAGSHVIFYLGVYSISILHLLFSISINLFVPFSFVEPF